MRNPCSAANTNAETAMSRWLLALAMLDSGACGASTSATDDGRVSATSTADSSSTTSLPGSASDVSSSSETTSVATDSSTGEGLDCSNGGPQLGCPVGCMDASAYLGTGDDIDFSSGHRSCIPAGAPLDASYRSAWWRDDGTAPRFLIAGHGCGAQIPAAPLENWQECGTSTDEPSECGRLCAQDVCPGELDLNELTACSVASPCPAASQPYVCEPVNPDLQCIHGALANRTPGRYDIEFPLPNLDSSWTFVVAGDGSVQVVSRRNSTTSCATALNGIWQQSKTCELAEAEFFTNCSEAQTWCGGDLDLCQSETLSEWLVACAETPVTCG